MRALLLGVTLFLVSGDRASDRDALLAADRSLSDKTAASGILLGFVPALTDDAAYLYPGAPLLRGSKQIRSFLARADSLMQLTWSPAFADVSADGRLATRTAGRGSTERAASISRAGRSKAASGGSRPTRPRAQSRSPIPLRPHHRAASSARRCAGEPTRVS